MAPDLPYGGREIAELRMQRQKPADMVLVSLVGPLKELNPVVMARAEKRYDWQFLAGLDVLLVASSLVDVELVKRTIDAIRAVKPEYFGLWLSDKKDGQHIQWGSYRPKSKAMRWMGPLDKKEFEGIGNASH